MVTGMHASCATIWVDLVYVEKRWLGSQFPPCQVYRESLSWFVGTQSLPTITTASITIFERAK
jgi:hypothetical protein